MLQVGKRGRWYRVTRQRPNHWQVRTLVQTTYVIKRISTWTDISHNKQISCNDGGTSRQRTELVLCVCWYKKYKWLINALSQNYIHIKNIKRIRKQNSSSCIIKRQYISYIYIHIIYIYIIINKLTVLHHSFSEATRVISYICFILYIFFCQHG